MNRVCLFTLGASLFLWSGIAVASTANINSMPKRYVVKRKAGVSSFFKGIVKGNSESKFKQQIEHVPNGVSATDFVKKLKAESDVVSVEEDIVMSHQLAPGDRGDEDYYYEDQWHYWEAGAGIRLEDAWDITLGSPNTVVAVVDTGIRNHVDLSGRILSGADMVSDTSMSNDGNGRDNDATDPGDWIGFGDPCVAQTGSRPSSWHGTHVAGTIAANTANGTGAAGINWRAKILPVRVLGKCGGYSTDIADGIRWAAGGSVSGVANNPHPAKVINLSLGGPGSCPSFMQDAINFATSRGALVVVAAGNSNVNMDFMSFTPANCANVLTVSASNHYGNRASYSNYGSRIDISAPGGENSDGVLSLHNGGTQGPGVDTYTAMAGTSMATPHVAGVASLMFAVGPDLPPLQIKHLLKQTASGSACGSCGSGMMDAAAAVAEADAATPDETFRVLEVSTGGGGTGNGGGQQDIYSLSQSSGGACGSVALANNDDDEEGPAGGGFFVSLLLGLLIFLIPARRIA